ncbi:MAG: class I SAM-dependent methyltransferase [Chthonomonas sp.]|nr:class I SAM-dependent methyltransferase [Chthonomonas sp.]
MFTAIAPYYNELMGAVDYEMWADYLLLLLEMRESHPADVLDVCCGTGTVSELLADMGYRVLGVDLSAPMIDEAQKRVANHPEQLEFIAADAATFASERRFDAAFSFFDSFNYITDLGHLRKVFANIARHLKPGTPFIFDLNTAYAFEAKMFDQEDTRKRSRVRYKWVGDYDPGTHVIRVNMQFWVDGREFTETHVQRAHSEDEIVDLLDAAGFTDIMIYDSYTLSPPRKRSDRVHYVATRG